MRRKKTVATLQRIISAKRAGRKYGRRRNLTRRRRFTPLKVAGGIKMIAVETRNFNRLGHISDKEGNFPSTVGETLAGLGKSVRYLRWSCRKYFAPHVVPQYGEPRGYPSRFEAGRLLPIKRMLYGATPRYALRRAKIAYAPNVI